MEKVLRVGSVGTTGVGGESWDTMKVRRSVLQFKLLWDRLGCPSKEVYTSNGEVSHSRDRPLVRKRKLGDSSSVFRYVCRSRGFYERLCVRFLYFSRIRVKGRENFLPSCYYYW